MMARISSPVSLTSMSTSSKAGTRWHRPASGYQAATWSSRIQIGLPVLWLVNFTYLIAGSFTG